MIVPEGTIEITENGENIDVSEYAKANVNVVQAYNYCMLTLNFTSQNYGGLVVHNVIENGKLIDKTYTGSVNNEKLNVKIDIGTYADRYRSFYVSVYDPASDAIYGTTTVTQGTIYKAGLVGAIILGEQLNFLTLTITVKAD